jgi:NAD(P)H-hydrate epimerase
VLPVFTAAEMRALDARHPRAPHSRTRLMEHAGSAAALIGRFRASAEVGGDRLRQGNNGGDGFVVASACRPARLRARLPGGRRAEVAATREALGRWRARRGDPLGRDLPRWRARSTRRSVGRPARHRPDRGARPGRGEHRADQRMAVAARRPVFALDLPSGLSADHGALLGPTVRAAAP